MSMVSAPDRFSCADDVEAALRGARRLRWEVRGEDAVLCGELGGTRVEVIPVGPHRCEVRVRVDVASLGRLVTALAPARRQATGPALGPALVLATTS